MSRKRFAGVMACWAMGLVVAVGGAVGMARTAMAEPPAKAPDDKPAPSAGGATGTTSTRTAEQILAEFDALQLAEPTFGSAEERAKALQERQRGVDRLNELAMELYRVSPEHERAGPLLYTRWNNMFPVEGGHQKVFDETGVIIGENKSTGCVTEALFWNAIATGTLNQMEPDKTIAAIDRFATHAPTDDRGARMMMSLANRLSRADQVRATALMRRVLERYPQTEQGKVAKTWLRVIDGLNKPFELTFNDAMTGERVDVQAMKGKVVIIDFWATWCGPCVREMPKLKALYEELKGQIEIVGVSLDKAESEGGLESLKKMVTEKGFGWKHYYQGKHWESEFSQSWGISSIPRVFVVDQNGMLVDTNARGNLEQVVRGLIAAKKAS